MVLMVTVLYHLIVVILKACKMYDRAREKINGLFERNYQVNMSEVKAPRELEELSYQPDLCGLRETLCED